MSLIAAALWILGTVSYHLAIASEDPAWLGWQGSDTVAAVSIAVSIAVYAYTRGDRDPRSVLNLGLVFMVVMAAGAGLVQHWDPNRAVHDIEPQISWMGAIVLMSAAVVPSSPVKMLIAGTLAVSMNPLGMLIARMRGVWLGPLREIAIMHYQDYFLVAVAVVISGVVTRLGQEVTKAREMGSYQLGDLIGRGGMGEVYRATHRMLARPAAVKLIRAEEARGSQESAQSLTIRFRREATAAANLRSPHTVELYDFGVTDDGTMYFAMELLDGLDLETLVRRTGPLPASRVVHILRQVCASLAEAHAAGLVHRDIKPANIHLGRLGLVDDFVKVLDFGLVKSTTAVDVTQTQATAHGTALGTPAYMAPEAALGNAIDGRTDLYSLGCVSYFLLTGELVFAGTEGLQMIVKRLHEDPAPPSTRTELVIPPELERVVMQCLSRDPAGRPQSALQLDELLATLPVPPWTAADAAEWWRLRGGRQ
jgi:serine/threonine-protein kinase